MKIPAYVPQLLTKHVNDVLHVIYFDEGKIGIKSGTLLIVNANSIVLNLAGESTKQEISFFKNDQVSVLNIYNRNYIDLMNAKATEPLSEKLKVRDIKKIILNNLRPLIGKEITMVSKVDNKLTASKGLLSNMGIAGASIKPAPFYNSELDMNYRNIFHIYSAENIDLLNVKIEKGA